MKALRRIEEAIRDYSKAIEINPQNANAFYNRGLYYLIIIEGSALDDLGRKEDAIKDYSKAIEINPQNAYAFNNRGLYY